MIKITKNGKDVEIPGGVDELSPEQWREYLLLVGAVRSQSISMEYFKVRLMSFLLGLKNLDYFALKPEIATEIDDQVDVALAGFFVDGAPSTMTCRNLWNRYEEYEGPGDWLNGMTWGEFIQCFAIMQNIGEDDSADATNEIARCLYHIPKDVAINPFLGIHVATLFGNVWSTIQTTPIEINGSKIDFRIIFQSDGESRRDDNTGWSGITFETASSGVFGTVKDVESTDFWQVMLYLYRCKFEYIEEKRKMKKL